MFFFHRTNSITATGLFILNILLVLTLMMFMTACSKDNADNLSGTVPSVSPDPPAGAGGRSPGTLADSFAGERQKDINRLNELQGKLIALQQKVLQENPDLQDAQLELRKAIETRLEKSLADRNVDVERIQELQTSLQDPNLPEEERGALLGEFQVQAQQYNQARAEAMNDELVQEKYKQYVTRMQTKMEAEDPEATVLTREFEEIQARLQAQQP